MNVIVNALWFLLPCYLANMAPVFGTKVFGRSKAINKKLFGENKTWVGFLLGVFAGIIGALIQGFLYRNVDFFKNISIIDYSLINLVYLGYYIGFAAMFGDLAKSFIKRKINIKPGGRLIPFDQLDFVIAVFIFISFIDFPGWPIVISGLISTFFLHIIVNHIGYYLKLRNTKW